MLGYGGNSAVSALLVHMTWRFWVKMNDGLPFSINEILLNINLTN